MTIKIMSLVGQRSLAVVSPLVSFLDQSCKQKDDVSIDIRFLATAYSAPIGDRCLQWLVKRYEGKIAQAAVYPFEEITKVIPEISGLEAPIYFNVNPAMN